MVASSMRMNIKAVKPVKIWLILKFWNVHICFYGFISINVLSGLCVVTLGMLNFPSYHQITPVYQQRNQDIIAVIDIIYIYIHTHRVFLSCVKGLELENCIKMYLFFTNSLLNFSSQTCQLL